MNETKHNTNQGRQPGSAHFVSRRHFIQTTAALARVAAALTSGLCLLSARSREASAGAMAAVLFSVFTAYAATDATNQPVIIFDTDMGSDVDDAGALAVLHRLPPQADFAVVHLVAHRPKTPAGTEAVFGEQFADDMRFTLKPQPTLPVQLSDKPLIVSMLTLLKSGDHNVGSAIELIVRSPQFREVRGKDYVIHN